jgi:peptidyl-prolyl cis-trans isomerase C
VTTSYQLVLDAPRSSTAKEGQRKSFLQFVARALREPLVHFLLIGAVFFGAYRWMNGGSNQGPSSKRIELTVDDLRQLEIYFESQWHRPPTQQEFVGLVESKVREEILYREALAMGLDKDDTIVKRRMAQKMEFLAEDVAKAHQPTSLELKTWYQNNSARFALPSRATFRHLYFSPDHRGKQAHDDAVKALERIAGQPANSKLAAALADPFMFQDYYGDRSPEQLAKEFGPSFAHAIFQIKPGAWQGPIESGYGWHLVFIDSFAPGRIPALEEVEPDVKTAWLADQREKEVTKEYAVMRAKYKVFLPVPGKETDNTPPAPTPHKEIPASPESGPQ